MKTLVVLLALLMGTMVAQDFPAPHPPTLKNYKAFEWVGDEHAHFEYAHVEAGDYVQIIVSCGIAHCAQPAYWIGPVEYKVPRLTQESQPDGQNTFGMQVFGDFSNDKGQIKIYIPVLYKGLVYSGSITVTKGPRP